MKRSSSYFHFLRTLLKTLVIPSRKGQSADKVIFTGLCIIMGISGSIVLLNQNTVQSFSHITLLDRNFNQLMYEICSDESPIDIPDRVIILNLTSNESIFAPGFNVLSNESYLHYYDDIIGDRWVETLAEENTSTIDPYACRKIEIVSTYDTPFDESIELKHSSDALVLEVQ